MDDIGERMARLAFVQVQAAREASGGVFLDYSPESLGVLDELIHRHMRRLRTDPAEVAEVVGAYVGEVLRRRHGLEWVEVDGRALLRRPDGGTLDPIARARRRLEEGMRFSLARYAEAVAAGRPNPEADAATAAFWSSLFRR
jgi:hypothetical protein